MIFKNCRINSQIDKKLSGGDGYPKRVAEQEASSASMQ